MTKTTLAGGATAVVLTVLALAAVYQTFQQDVDPASARSQPSSLSTGETADAHESYIYGRITTDDGTVYQGRLRFGGDEEAFWGDYFNGFKDENPWIAHVPPEQLKEQRTTEIFGLEIEREHQVDLGRPFMGRFGDIARVEVLGRDIRVTLKSGTTFDLNRFSADDVADGVRVWDGQRGVVDLSERQIRTIEFLPAAGSGTAPNRLHGTVRTRQGTFAGFLQWNREESMGTDALDGHTADGALRLRFDTIRSITRVARDSALVTLLDDREIVLTGTRAVGQGNRGIYVDDERYGRVLVSWEAFDRVDFSRADSAASTGPAYGDFPPGRPLSGSVTTRAGHRFAGRLVYDLDESETTETLDAPSQDVNYTIPFGLVASLALPDREGSAGHAEVILHSGEELLLERSGDLGEGNAGLLVFVEGREHPEYLPWANIEQIDFAHPSAMPPPASER